ncbi:MAG: HAD hydrolase family protein [Bdellovibrionales bacterium]|nr:HAD hydrolase family protein [Bdellovibrionales bacterium]
MTVSPTVFILDVDGVMTDGRMYYTQDGKAMKAFGPDDHDALTLLKPHLSIHVVSGDKRGFDISRARIQEDMQLPLDLVSTIHRKEWLAERWDLNEVIYMGDGIFDHYVLEAVRYGIAPANGHEFARNVADYVTKRSGGDRAVAEAALHILDLFFQPYDKSERPRAN